MPVVKIREFPKWTPQDENRKQNVVEAAKLMATAALTAPKGGGVDQIEVAIVSGVDELERVATAMEELAHRKKGKLWQQMFLAESVMVRESDVLLLLGNYRANNTPLDAGCGLCNGDMNCEYFYAHKVSWKPFKFGRMDNIMADPEIKAKKLFNGPMCGIRTIDSGFAMASVQIIANRLFVDYLPSFAASAACQKLGYLPKSDWLSVVLLSARQKSPYADIMPDYHLFNLDEWESDLRKLYITSRLVWWYDYRSWYPKSATEEGVDESTEG